jgi:hypothetical protein
MSTEKKPEFIRLTLTTEQQAHVRASVGVDAKAVELSMSELEERIAPAGKVTMNDFHFVM